MGFQVTLIVTDCASGAAVPFPTATDGYSTLTGDSYGHLVVTILGDYVGFNTQVAAANYYSTIVQLAATEHGTTRSICLNRVPATPPRTSGGW